MEPRPANLLTVNSGSSSLKLAIYRRGGEPRRVLSAEATAIGQPRGVLTVRGALGQKQLEREQQFNDHCDALAKMFEVISQDTESETLVAAGHRVVHGGLNHRQPTRLDASVLADLKQAIPLAPDHLPQAIALISWLAERKPGLPQIACFDTEFHRTLPARARTLPIPHTLSDEGVVRYGFHGLSYEYLVEQLRTLDPRRAGGRAVLAHLGSGASLAAVSDGVSIDTSMGFTPAGGLMMSSRTGDLDPGVLLYLMRAKGYAAETLNRLINRESGLTGVSGTSASMKQLLQDRKGNPRAALAVEMFCYQAKKLIAGYGAALMGLDTLVFSGGIGENAADIRREICSGLEFMGVALDPARNEQTADVISSDTSRVLVRVIRTDEDLMIARNVSRLLAQ